MADDARCYRLRDGGVELVVETWSDDRNRARLLVDGVEVDAGDTDEVGQVDLDADGEHHTRVRWWWKGRVAGCDLVEVRDGLPVDVPRRMREVVTPYEPPTGTLAHRVHRWGHDHPRLYASRHVAVKVLGTLAAIVGLGALVRALVAGLLPRIDLDWVPDVEPPGWLRHLDPVTYLRPVVEPVVDAVRRLFGWLPDVELPGLGWVRYAVGLLVAVAIAVEEVRRRRARDERERAASDGRGAPAAPAGHRPDPADGKPAATERGEAGDGADAADGADPADADRDPASDDDR